MNELEQKINYILTKNIRIIEELKQHPSFIEFIEKMKQSIFQACASNTEKIINLMEKSGTITYDVEIRVERENKKVVVEKTRYKLIIKSDSETSLTYTLIEETPPKFDKEGKTIREKNAMEQEIKLLYKDKEPYTTITSRYSSIDTKDCKAAECNNTFSAEQAEYNQEGIMIKRDIKQYSPYKISQIFDNITPNTMLYIPRKAFTPGLNEYNTYSHHTIMTRNKIHTANLYYEDKKEGIIYKGNIMLSQEHGLKDMTIPSGIDISNQPKLIPKLTEEQINEIIGKETNPRVKEGMYKYIQETEQHKKL